MHFLHLISPTQHLRRTAEAQAEEFYVGLGRSSLQKISDHVPIFILSAKQKPIVPPKFITVRDFSVKNVSPPCYLFVA
jgi:hypothetical protein